MRMHWSRGVSLLLSLLSAILAAYPRRLEPVLWERLGAQALGIALIVLARRYPARRPQILLGALAVGGATSLMEQGRRRRGQGR